MLTVFVNRSQKQRKTHIEKERLFNFISFTIKKSILKKKVEQRIMLMIKETA